MEVNRLDEAYHMERALVVRQGIRNYPCACMKCHGFLMQRVEVVEQHHRRFGRDRNLTDPLLGSAGEPAPPSHGDHAQEEAVEAEEEFVDASDEQTFHEVPPQTNVNFEQMAQNYFASRQ